MKYLIITLSVLLGGMAVAGDLYVIANSSLSATDADVKDIFTGDKGTIGGTKVVPADNKAAMADFLSKVMQMDEGKYTTLWSKKNFRDGVPLPKQMSTDAATIDFVKSTPGGVGYVQSAPSADVKTLLKK